MPGLTHFNEDNVCNHKQKIITVNVRWGDGYLETFEASEVRFGRDLLWIRLINGPNRHIPLREVRWFSTNPESHEMVDTTDPYKWPNGR